MTINEKINQIYGFIFAGHDKNIIMKAICYRTGATIEKECKIEYMCSGAGEDMVIVSGYHDWEVDFPISEFAKQFIRLAD